MVPVGRNYADPLPCCLLPEHGLPGQGGVDAALVGIDGCDDLPDEVGLGRIFVAVAVNGLYAGVPPPERSHDPLGEIHVSGQPGPPVDDESIPAPGSSKGGG